MFASSGAAASGLFATDPGTSLYSSLCEGNLELRPGTGPLRRGDEAGSPGALGQSVSKDLLAALGTPAAPVPVSPEASQETGDVSPMAAGSSPGGPSWGPIAGGAVAAAVLLAGLAAGPARRARRR
ncbi:hypothetical protein [Nonomuraea sp. bgisy101]|uniref:hypothetical protein n=1 Tax=Nonomuraea sp. bgisy101 TaxID=3413784 RepID=UPI003D754CF8